MTTYYLVPVRVINFSAGILGVRQTTLPPTPPIHTVHYNNAQECSLALSTQTNGAPLTAIPQPNQVLHLALSAAFCASHGISTVGLIKSPATLDGAEPVQTALYSLRVAEIESLVLTLKNGKSIDLNNPPLARAESVHFDAEGCWSVVLTETGKQLLGLPGLLRLEGSGPDFRAHSAPSIDPQKVRALIAELTTLIE